MSAPDGRVPRPRALHVAPPQRPVRDSESPVRDAWFSYQAPDDRIVWSEGFEEMLGHQPADNEPGRQVVARYVHRDDRATALGAITRSWTSGETVHVTIRMVRADGGWFDADVQIDPIVETDGTISGVRGVVRRPPRTRPREVAAGPARRQRQRRAGAGSGHRPVTGRFADELDGRCGGAAARCWSSGSSRIAATSATSAGSQRRPAASRRPRAGEMVRGADLLGRVGRTRSGSCWPCVLSLARRQADRSSSAAHTVRLPTPGPCPRLGGWYVFSPAPRPAADL